MFTTQGARLKSFKFKKYRASADETSPPFEMVQTAPGVPLPLGVRWQTPEPFDDNNLNYSLQAGGDLQLTGEAKGTLVFHGQKADGALVIKSFTFTGAAYPIQMEVSVKAASAAPIPAILITARADHSAPITTRPSRDSTL